MKTIEELYKEIAASKELQKELESVSAETFETFLKKHGCEASAEEFIAFVKAQSEGEISDDAAAEAAGGFWIQFVQTKPAPFVKPETSNFDW